MGDAVQSIFGFVGDLLGGGPKQTARTVSTEPAESITAAGQAAKGSRVRLLSTAAGLPGEELSSSQVKKRETIFGN